MRFQHSRRYAQANADCMKSSVAVTHLFANHSYLSAHSTCVQCHC